MDAGRGRGESWRKRTGAYRGRGFKPGEYVHIMTVYFPFLKIISIRKKNENDWGNAGFTDVTSE